jgi:hypothetical protein
VLAELARAVPQKTVELRGSDKTAPQTVFFQTREGTAGTLQVLPMPEKRGVVTIRYKLLQPGGAAPSPQAP